MIPKIIHYCWLSNDEMPENIKRCIYSWTQHLSDYQIIKWDFAKFPKGTSKWVDQAFERKKYAFAADYIRLHALYHYGGIYLDSDVEVIRSFNDFIKLNDMICYENSSRNGLEVAAMGVAPKREWIKNCLDYYSDREFDMGHGVLNTKVMPEVVKAIISKGNWKLQEVNSIQEAINVDSQYVIPIFPFEYFSPKSYETGKIKITPNTYSIHHFAASWYGPKEKLYQLLGKIIGKKNAKELTDYIRKCLLRINF